MLKYILKYKILVASLKMPFLNNMQLSKIWKQLCSTSDIFLYFYHCH